MNFIMGLPISIDLKEESYDSILVIIDWLTKMVYYKLLNITINLPGLAKDIIDMVVNTLAYPTQLWRIKALSSPRNSGHRFAISLASSNSFLPRFTYK